MNVDFGERQKGKRKRARDQREDQGINNVNTIKQLGSRSIIERNNMGTQELKVV